MQLPLPLLKNVVLVGGGHAHALVLRKWAMKPVAGAQLTIINPRATAPYTGMLPGFIAGHYERHELDIDLVKLARFAGARLVFGTVTSIDRESQKIIVPGRPEIPYDVCSIDVGITSAMPQLAGFDQHGIAAKPLGRFARRWSAYVESLTPGDGASAVVIGGGVGGCELAMAMQHRLVEHGARATVTVVDSSQVLADVGERARHEILAAMAKADITVLEHREVHEVTPFDVRVDNDLVLPSNFTVGAAGARPYEWLSEIGLQTNAGFITIDNTLRSISDPAIFAVGDCADMAFDPRPKAGVFAVRQAPVLYKNLRSVLTDDSARRRKLATYDPQTDYLKLISLGAKRAAADKFRRFMQGKQIWRLKNKIDRDFMDKLDDLPEMELPKLPSHSVAGLQAALDEEPPLCGGCGAKVGADILSGPLAQLPASTRDDIVRLPGDDAALLEFGDVRQVVTTDSLRSFTTDPYRMAKIAALHAMGDIWAMGASPQAVLVTVTLPQLGRSLQSEWLREIMAGASEVLLPTGAEIVGGHTSMGAELSLGFSITGLLTSPAITLAGARPGQKLILTRALGSGVLFAAEMQMKANGNDIEALLATLETPQGTASEILAEAGATAMTDVTGFGLAGHLFGMLRESEVAAELLLDDIPIFDGALTQAIAGTRSHLHAANQVGVPIVMGADDPRTALLFDPQTAGGFLASVPSDQADTAIERLQASGFDAVVIGTVREGAPSIEVISAG